MKKSLALSLLVLISLTLQACALARSAAPGVDQTMPVEGFAPEPGFAEPGFEGPPMAVEEPQLAGRGAVTSTSDDRLVVMNASLTIVVPDPVASVREIMQLAERMGGFVVSSNTYQSTFGLEQVVANQAQITIRVPAERLNEALAEIKEGASDVQNENIQGEDVTAAYTDLESRLRNLEATEAALREIMASATRTEDVMLVFNQLSQVRGEIEMVRGQMRYYEESARLSAISVDLIPDVAEQPIDIGGWHPEGVAKQAIEDLVHALQGLADAVIRFGILWIPLLAVFGVPFWLIMRAIVRRRRAKRAAPPASQ